MIPELALTFGTAEPTAETKSLSADAVTEILLIWLCTDASTSDTVILSAVLIASDRFN